MKPQYLLDTNACIAIRNSFRSIRSRDPARRAAMYRFITRWNTMASHEIAMSFVTLGELAVWAEKHADPLMAHALLNQLKAMISVLGATDDTSPHGVHALAHGYGEIRANLERRGVPIGANDLWIAAHAAIRGMTVVTGNTSEFQRVPGLPVEDWTV
jgi:tRNA(fMet)-specific endonuclease VapC